MNPGKPATILRDGGSPHGAEIKPEHFQIVLGSQEAANRDQRP